MALIDEGIVALLAGTGAVTAVTDRIYTDDAPQNEELPHIIVTLLTEDPMVTFGGTTGLRAASIDIDIVAKTRPAANALADIVEAFIDDYTGTAGSQTIKSVVLNPRGNDFEPKGQGTEQSKYITTLDCLVHYT